MIYLNHQGKHNKETEDNKMIVMDKRDDRVYFDTIEEAKEWAGCDDESITTAEDLEDWMTKENGGVVIHTFDEVEE